MFNTLNEHLAVFPWILSHRVDWDFTFSSLHGLLSNPFTLMGGVH